jgi:hypothetical protein
LAAGHTIDRLLESEYPFENLCRVAFLRFHFSIDPPSRRPILVQLLNQNGFSELAEVVFRISIARFGPPIHQAEGHFVLSGSLRFFNFFS